MLRPTDTRDRVTFNESNGHALLRSIPPRAQRADRKHQLKALNFPSVFFIFFFRPFPRVQPQPVVPSSRWLQGAGGEGATRRAAASQRRSVPAPQQQIAKPTECASIERGYAMRHWRHGHGAAGRVANAPKLVWQTVSFPSAVSVGRQQSLASFLAAAAQ